MRRGTFLTALREGTAAQHQSLEGAAPFGRPLESADQYLGDLVTMAGIHLPLEERLYAAFDWEGLGLPEAKQRERAGLLRQDLRALGLSAEGLSWCRELPALSGLGAWLGCLYVLEGSTLGGQVLARRVTSFSPQLPVTFLSGAGAETGRRWQSLCAFLEGLAEQQPALVEPGVRGARDTFEAMGAWFRRQGHQR